MKSMFFICAILVSAAWGFGTARAADRVVADSLALSGATLAAKGNTSQAKDMLYKALANDENCPDAIFELAKIFDKENAGTTAGDFYQRALMLMAQENKPATTAKRAEADRRVKALNPFAPRFSAIFEEYAQDLDKLVKKVTDTGTQDAAAARVTELKMTTVLTPEKMPKFYANVLAQKTAAAAAAASAAASAKKPKSARDYFDHETPAKIVTNVPPEVERELKALGWATITGTWVKKAPNVYEVTDGKLEAAKINGGVDVSVFKGVTGSVKVAVRNDFASNESSSSMVSSSSMMSDYNFSGYGALVKSKLCKLYAPGGYSGYTFNGSKAEPAMARSESLPDANPKNHVLVTINEGALEISLNEKKWIKYKDDKLPRSGPFVIEIKGTAILENPRCAGQ